MRRVLPLAVMVALAISGCTRVAWVASPAPSPSVVVPAVVDPPTPTVSPAPTPLVTTPAGRSCAGPAATVNRPRATEAGPHGSHRSTGSAAVALTFDDGPDPVNTPRILDVLRDCGVKATFCVVGEKVALYPDVVRRIVAEGHSLCNHTWRHIMQLGGYGPLLIRQDLQLTNDAIHAAVPGARVSYFRAPGGNWSDDFVTVAQEMGLVSIDWDVDPRDWSTAQYGAGQAMTNHIVSTVESTVRPGSIVLSHDYQKPATTAAYRILLPWLAARFDLIALPPVLAPEFADTPAAGARTPRLAWARVSGLRSVSRGRRASP